MKETILVLIIIVLILIGLNIYKWLKISILYMEIEEYEKTNETVLLENVELQAENLKLSKKVHEKQLIINQLKSQN